jgi:hypothetical protein
MLRSLVLVTLFLLAGTDALGAGISIGGAGPFGYTCTKEGGQTPTCTCSGYFDCKEMVDDRVCRRGITECGVDRKTNTETCSCQWRTSIMPKGDGRVLAPELEMKTK